MARNPLYVVLVRIDTRADPLNETIVTSRWFSDGAWNDPVAGIFPKPRIAKPITFKRAITTVYWGGGRTRPSFGDLVLLAGDDRSLDWMFAEPLRDADVAIYMVAAGQPFTAARQVAAARVDNVHASDETTVTIKLADTSALLERPVQSDLYSVEGLEGQPRPLSIGTCYSVPVWQGGLPDLLYDVHDDLTAEVSLVRDMGVELSISTDWTRPKDPPHHIELVNSPVGRVVADVAGAVSAIDIYLDNDFSDADQWVMPGPVPVGWSIEVTAGSGAVSRITEGAWLRNGTFPPDPSIAALVSSELQATGLWYIRVDVSPALFVGEVEVGLTQAGPGFQLIATITEPGSYLFTREVEDLLGSDQIIIRTRGRSGLNFPSAVLSGARIYRRVAGAGPGTSTGEVEALLRYLLVDRAGWPESQVDWSSVSRIAAFNWTFGYHTPRPIATTSILDDLARSWGGWWATDRLGRLRIGRVPILDDFPTPGLSIGPGEIAGGIAVAIDRAPGLSDTWSGGRNWQTYSESELAGAVQGTALGSLLSQQFRWRKRSTVEFFRGYRDALARPTTSPTSSREIDRDDDVGVPTLLQSEADVQQAADYAGILYSVPRHWLTLTCLLDPVRAAKLEPGEIVNVISQRWGLDSNSRFLLTEADGAIGSGQVRLKLWGDITLQPPPPILGG